MGPLNCVTVFLYFNLRVKNCHGSIFYLANRQEMVEHSVRKLHEEPAPVGHVQVTLADDAAKLPETNGKVRDADTSHLYTE